MTISAGAPGRDCFLQPGEGVRVGPSVQQQVLAVGVADVVEAVPPFHRFTAAGDAQAQPHHSWVGLPIRPNNPPASLGYVVGGHLRHP